jgi:hypothetical protein
MKSNVYSLLFAILTACGVPRSPVGDSDGEPPEDSDVTPDESDVKDSDVEEGPPDTASESGRTPEDSDTDDPEDSTVSDTCSDDTSAPDMINYSATYQSIQLPDTECRTYNAVYLINRHHWQAWLDDPAVCGQPADCDDSEFMGVGGVVADDGAIFWLLRTCPGGVVDPHFLDDQGRLRLTGAEPSVCPGG